MLLILFLYTVIYMHIHPSIHTYIHTCIHTYIHTYIHIYIHTYRNLTHLTLFTQYSLSHNVRRKNAVVGDGGGASAVDPTHQPPSAGRPLSLQSPHIPDRDYQSPTHSSPHRPGSAGSYGDRGQPHLSRKSSLTHT